MYKKFFSIILSVIMVVSLFATGVLADETKGQELIFDERGMTTVHVNKDENPDGFILKLDKAANVSFLTKNGSKITVTGDRSVITYTRTDREMMYLVPGEYTVKVNSTDDELQVSLWYLSFKFTRGSQEYVLHGNEYIAVGKGEEYSLEAIPGEGFNYEFGWTSKSNENAGIQTQIKNKADFVYPSVGTYDQIALMVRNADTEAMAYVSFKVLLDEHLTFDRGFINNHLVDPNGSITLSYTGKGDNDVYAVSLENGKETISFEKIAVPFVSIGLIEGNCADGMSLDYVFVNDKSSVEKIESGKKIHIVLSDIDPENEELDVSGGDHKATELQKIYSFTPDKTGNYSFKSSGNADPYCALFDSDLNCLAYSDDPIEWWTFEVMTRFFDCKYDKYTDYNFNITTKLEAGKTYYFFVVNSTSPNYELADVITKIDSEFDVELIDLDNKPEPDPIVPDPSNDEVSFEDFVERLYTVALGRASEKEGKDYWCELVGNGTLTGADCARFFLTSPEFKGRGLSDEEFLKVLYKTFFDRDAAADPDGFNFWMNSLKSVGKDTVVEGFINSPEWCDICATYGVKSGAPTAKATKASKNATAFATRLYTECLGREPEEGGLKYWSLGLTNLELTGSQAAHEFFYSKEFNDHNFDNKELLTRMYRTFMGREPDTDGLNYWLGNMNNGMTKDQVFNSFVQSQEFTEICASYAITR